jgi:nucleoside-diphosphate-sugar epimerase
MKVLLLGAGGFIGANLVERLLADDVHDIIAIDIARQKIEHLLKNKRLKFVACDIRHDDGVIEKLVRECDVVVDLIALANPSLYVERPLDVFELNFTENLKIAESCVRGGKRLVQFSTCEVYGKTPAAILNGKGEEMECPFHEDSSPFILGPIGMHRWIYASAKQLLERVLHAYGLEGRLNYTIIRPFNFIGPRIDFLPSEHPGNPRVISHFMDALLHGTPMKLVNGGKSLRTYTYIDDAVDCIVRIIDNANGVCDRQIFNIGTPGNETSIRGLAELMREIFSEHFRRNAEPLPEIVSVSSEEFYGSGYDDCDRRIPDIAKATTLLGWKPKHDLRSAVLKTMEYFIGQHRPQTNQ